MKAVLHHTSLRNQKDAPVSRFLAGEIRLVDFFRKNRCNSKKKNPEPLKSRQNLLLAQNDKRTYEYRLIVNSQSEL